MVVDRDEAPGRGAGNVQGTEREEGWKLVIRQEGAAEDKGGISGRQGRVVPAMRILLRVAASKKGTRAVLEVV